jgi:hypothetical protein
MERRMTTGQHLELLMLFCFSIGWYWSIARMLRTGRAAGKSLTFVILVCTGYALGVASKLAHWRDGAELSPLVWVYGWNCLVVALDMALVVALTRRERVVA